jgi:hypothetical protein
MSVGPMPFAVLEALPRGGGTGIGVSASSGDGARSGNDAERCVCDVRSAGASARANAPANSLGVSNSWARACAHQASKEPGRLSETLLGRGARFSKMAWSTAPTSNPKKGGRPVNAS